VVKKTPRRDKKYAYVADINGYRQAHIMSSNSVHFDTDCTHSVYPEQNCYELA